MLILPVQRTHSENLLVNITYLVREQNSGRENREAWAGIQNKAIKVWGGAGNLGPDAPLTI